MLTKDDKKDITNIVVDVINDLLVPSFELVYKKFEEIDEKMVTKADLARVETRLDNRLDNMEGRLDTMEGKLDRVIDNQLADRGKLADYERRLKKLERPLISS